MIVIDRQIEAANLAGRDVAEQLPLNHGRALLVMEIEAHIRTLVGLLADLGRTTARTQDTFDTGCDGVDELSLAIYDRYARLTSTFAQAADLVQSAEGWGYTVDGKADFLQSWRTLRGVASLSTHRVRAAAAAASRGELRPLGVLRDELRTAAHG